MKQDLSMVDEKVVSNGLGSRILIGSIQQVMSCLDLRIVRLELSSNLLIPHGFA